MSCPALPLLSSAPPRTIRTRLFLASRRASHPRSGLNQLLLYVQDPESFTIRPWVFVVAVGTSNLIVFLALNYFHYVCFRVWRQMESLMLQVL